MTPQDRENGLTDSCQKQDAVLRLAQRLGIHITPKFVSVDSSTGQWWGLVWAAVRRAELGIWQGLCAPSTPARWTPRSSLGHQGPLRCTWAQTLGLACPGPYSCRARVVPKRAAGQGKTLW